MSAVIFMISKPSEHVDGLIVGNPASVRTIEIETLESGEWVDTELTPRDGRRLGENRLMIVVARQPVYLLQVFAGQTPEGSEANAVPIPVAEDGITSYSCIVHPETRRVFVKAPAIPEDEPTRPWWLAWWPF